MEPKTDVTRRQHLDSDEGARAGSSGARQGAVLSVRCQTPEVQLFTLELMDVGNMNCEECVVIEDTAATCAEAKHMTWR